MAEETKPTGTLPRNLQVWALAAVALLIVGVIFFTPASKKPTIGGSSPEQQKELNDAKQEIERSMASLREAQSRAQQEALTAQRDAEIQALAQPTPDPNATSGAQEDELEKTRKKREYDAQFASNVALSYRPKSEGTKGSSSASSEPEPEPGTPEAEFAALKRQLTDISAGMNSPSAAAQTTPVSATQDKRNTTALNRSRQGAPVHTIFEGSFFEAVLVTRLAGDFAGPVLATSTAPLYSRNRQAVLVPTGTKLIGDAKRVDDQNQERLAVVFHRAIMPDGYSLDLDQFAGLQGGGETALKDAVNHHYIRTFGTSIALGLLGGLSAMSSEQTNFGLPATAQDRYRQGFGESMGQQASSYLQSHTNVMPTITIREGHRLRVYISQDFRIPAYPDHRMDPAI